MIVCIEGLDGAGKTTQVHMLYKHFRSKGVETTVIPHPDYSSAYGKMIKEYLHGSEKADVKALFLTYLADIVKDSEKIRDADRKGVAILDRYYASTVAYQSAGGFPYENAKVLVLLLDLPVPDKLFYLDIKPEEAFRRKSAMDTRLDRHEKDIEFLGKVRQFYLEQAYDKFPSRWVVFDSMESKEKIHESIVNEVNKSYKKLKR